jgi:hypothetical protein
MNKYRSMQWARHIAYTGNKKYNAVFWWGDMKERDHLGDLDVDGKITLKLTWNKIGW